MDYLYMLNNSLCKHCLNRVTRVISTEGLDVVFEEDDEETDNFIHDSCLILCIDLDHIVLDCNKFLKIPEKGDGKYLLNDINILDNLKDKD